MDILVKHEISLSPELAAFLTTIFGGAPAKAPVKSLASAPAASSPATTGTVVTKEMLQTFTKNNKTKRDAIVAVLGKFGAASVSTAEEKDYAAIYAEFQKL